MGSHSLIDTEGMVYSTISTNDDTIIVRDCEGNIRYQGKDMDKAIAISFKLDKSNKGV